MNARIDVSSLLPAWQRFQASTKIGPVRDEAHYRRMVATLDALLAAADGDESHPAMGLADVVGDFIADYEAEHHALPATRGIDALQYLMQQHGLRQCDLPEVGSQGVVSEVLSGRRELNVRQIRALAKRFRVSPATFF